MQLTDERLVRIREQLAPDAWEARVGAARAEAAGLDPVVARVCSGEAAIHVMRELFPHRNAVHMVRRLRAYQAGGVQALIDRRFVRRASLITPEVVAAVRAALAADPELRSRHLCDIVRTSLGVDVPGSTMRQWLRSQGLSQRSGPPGPRTGGELASVRIPNAGAELLKAVNEDLGATQALTDAMTRVLAALPAPEGPVLDDRAGRDEGGRFTAAYNEPQEREDPDLGPRFGSVEQRREQKDLRRMRVARSSPAARHRKDLALTYLPIVVEGARWSELRHWRGQHLDTLVGHAFQPATLDKHARELKLAGVSRAMQHAVASFWAKHEAHEGGAVILYCDTFTKPIWTRHYARSTLVARTGRVQPAVSTAFLHSGAGTPLLYESYPGHVSLPKQVCRMLAEWEAVAGAGTAQRLVVLDREAHSAALFKELDAAGWMYLVPVRQRSARPDSRWEDMGPWVPLDPEEEAGAEVRDAHLWLNDSKAKGAEARALRVRAITRRTDGEDDGATWVTNAPRDLFTPSELLALYSGRWAHQEHVFRDGNGRVGLHRHYGYGKRKVDHVALIDQREKLAAQARRAREQHARLVSERSGLDEQLSVHQLAVDKGRSRIRALQDELRGHIARGGTITEELQETQHILTQWESWADTAERKLQTLQERHEELQRKADRHLARAEAKEELHSELDRKTEIYTVDVELDEIMTAYKLTFMNLATTLMRDHLKVTWQLDHLIQAVLTLPGRRRQTPVLEVIEIFRQERDPETMEAVERACESLNQRELRRGSRLLRFSVIDSPDASQ